MTKPLFSVIIPIRIENDYLKQTLAYLGKQTLKDFEVLVVTDKISGHANPAQKRNLGAKMAKGKYLAFLDDDSYPDAKWLESAKVQLDSDPRLAAVGGPCLTPPEDSFSRQASGLVWASYLGSGGAGVYRNRIAPPRFVDDYPSVNLIVKKTDFLAVGGYDTHHWPGEDTILCLNLTHRLQKRILYHPSIIVYHHRRPLFGPHLKQISRYALHRGHFARKFPQTSFRPGYLIPSLFFIYLLLTPLAGNFFPVSYYLFPLYLYISILLFTLFWFILITKNIFTSLLATMAIPITHLYYGFLFIVGFFNPSLQFKAHQVDLKTGQYLGG